MLQTSHSTYHKIEQKKTPRKRKEDEKKCLGINEKSSK